MENNLESICSKYGIALLYLFGSQAGAGMEILSGEQVAPDDPLTDLDVGVITKTPLPQPPWRARLFAALYNDLEDLFKPFRLDLVLLEETHSVFQAEALKGICIYRESEEKQDDYEMMILRRAADFRPFLKKFLQEVLEEVN